jgi:tetratricopeptide (TPR) repeat protein
VHSDLGEKKRALEFFELALPLRRAVGDRSGEAVTLHNIGSVHSALGEKKRALEFFELALPLRRAVGDRSGEAVTLFNIAHLRDEEGNTAEAIALLERVVEIDMAIEHPDLASDRAALEGMRAKQQASAIQSAAPKRASSLFRWLLFALILVAATTWLVSSR